MQQVKADVHEMGKKVDKIFTALTGSDMMNDGGLIGRVYRMEKGQRKLEEELEELKRKNIKLAIYQRITWSLAGGGLTAIIGYAIQQAFKH